MKVRRVRLLPQDLDARAADLLLRAPRARRVPGRLDRVRVRSVWLQDEQADLATRWGWKPEPDAQVGPVKPSLRAAPASGEPPGDFLPGLRELLRPDVRAVLRREEWPQPLYPFQEEGVLFLYERRAALLADDMGLGKTVQALAAAGLLLSTGAIRQALVLCPAPLITNWMREARRWLPRLEGHVWAIQGDPVHRFHTWHSRAPLLIAGYETFRSDAAAGRLPPRTWDLVILDEAQRIKNEDTELAHLCKALPRQRSWALTGTPLENRREELISLLEWVSGEKAIRFAGVSSLRAAQQSYQLRRTKESVALELPAKTTASVLLELGAQQRAAYDRLQREGVLALRERGEEVRVTHVFSLLTRLKQVCNFCPASGESVKLDYLRAQLAEITAAGRQALVFSQFTAGDVGLRRLAQVVPGMALYHGGISPAARDAVVQGFQSGETPVLGISLRAGGVGLNLQRASYVFHFDRWWNPAVERQAEDRAHRMGQELPVTVYRLITSGTIEERIDALLASKEALFREVVEGAPTPALSPLSVDDLFGLLDLEAPPPARQEAGALRIPSVDSEEAV